MQEQNIIAKNVVDITVIYLKMDQTQLEKDIATMGYVWFLNLRASNNV